MRKLKIPITLFLLASFIPWTLPQSTIITTLIPPYPGDATKFLNGIGQWGTPAGGGGSTNIPGTVIASGSAPGAGPFGAFSAFLVSPDGTLTNAVWNTNVTFYPTATGHILYLAGPGDASFNTFNIIPDSQTFSGGIWSGVEAYVESYITNNIRNVWMLDTPWYHYGSGTITNWFGFEPYFENDGSGKVRNVIGARVGVFNTSTGTIENFDGYTFYGSGVPGDTTPIGNTGGGIFGTLTMFHATKPTGTFTNRLHGLLIDDWSSGVTASNGIYPILYNGGFFVNSSGLTSSTNGIASYARDATLEITATGLTNTLGKNAVARLDGTNLVYVIKNNAGTAIYTNSIAVGRTTELLQSGGSLVITSGTLTYGNVTPF